MKIPQNSPSSRPRFCSKCGTRFLPNALFCHNCGSAASGSAQELEAATSVSPILRWALPAVAIVVLVALSFYRLGSGATPQAPEQQTPLASGAITPPDISSMSPEERANRLFNQVMRLWSENKPDSAAFFAPMALASLEALTPVTLHSRYDMGLVALASGDIPKASAQGDTILKENPTHLLGLSLAARVADARGDTKTAKRIRQKLVAAEKSERAKALPEYQDHDADLRAALDLARHKPIRGS